MKKVFSLVMLTVFFIACNNSDQTTPSKDSLPAPVDGNVPDTTSGLGLPPDTSLKDTTKH